MTKSEFKMVLDGSFTRKLRAAYVSGYDDGYDDGAYQGTAYTEEEIEGMFQAWLRDTERHDVPEEVKK